MLMALSKLLYRDHESNRTKLRDWAVREARAGYYSQAALSSNDSKTLYFNPLPKSDKT